MRITQIVKSIHSSLRSESKNVIFLLELTFTQAAALQLRYFVEHGKLTKQRLETIRKVGALRINSVVALDDYYYTTSLLF